MQWSIDYQLSMVVEVACIFQNVWFEVAFEFDEHNEETFVYFVSQWCTFTYK